jgi:hypothetical protein
MVSLFEVFYVFVISIRMLNSKIMLTFIYQVQFFVTNLNFLLSRMSLT